MTNNNSESRLDRIERILEQNAIRQEKLILQQEAENKRIISIERTVQAMLDQRVTDRLEHEERMAKYDQQIEKYDQILARLVDVQHGMARMLSSKN